MTQQQFIEEIKQLSVADRIALIEAISRSVREDLEVDDSASTSGLGTSQAEDQYERERKTAAVGRLRGILKFNGNPPTDEEVKDAYADYLLEKYS